MRLFLGLSLPPAVARQLAAGVEQVKTKVPATSWVPPQNWHITLLFLGEVASDTAAIVRRRFTAVAQDTPPFTLRLQGWGAFPNMKRAKLLWVGVEGERDKLDRLAASVRAAVTGLIPVDGSKSFVPHMTLTRKVPELNITNLNSQIPFRTQDWEVNQMHLYISHLSPRGARYEIWQTYPFKR